jgi:ABC-type antimicrobial peptide transport system permease subunit
MRGRAFSERDDSAGAPVAIINQAMAHRYWPMGNPIGGRVLLGQNYGPEFKEPAREIVGVVGDVLDFGSKAPQPVVYVPVPQVTDGITALLARASSLAWTVRTQVEPHSLEPAIKSVLQQAIHGVAITKVRSMDDVVVNSTAAESFQTTLLTIFAAAALLLAAIGMYGMIAYSTQQRTHEIGIRLALGAEPSRVRNMLMFEGIRWALLGSGFGMVASFGLSRVLAGFLFGVKAWDALTFCGVPLFLIAVLLVAVWLPSRRATRVDPLVALRYE